jgi:predicted RNA methylase
MDHSFLKDRALILLKETDPGILLKTTHELAAWFEDITGIGDADISTGKNIMLPSGKAIAPGKAAFCLKEFMRTQVFLQGIFEAINDLLLQKETIHIVYAGTGPYGTLITPLLTLFSPQQLRLTLIEINPISLEAIRKLYTHLQLDGFADEYLLTDAATYQLPPDKIADIIISETMLAALKNEPQVAIMQNLIPQLKPGGIFIPQQIKVAAQLTNFRSEMAYSMGETDSPGRVFLKDIYTISQASLPGEAETVVSIPQEATNKTITLFTDIYVYKDNLLTVNNCSLNMPINVIKIDAPDPVSQITFKYLMGEKPGFQFRLN